GTAAYMSPEQAKGKSVDKRADIWAFGCILHECLSSKTPRVHMAIIIIVSLTVGGGITYIWHLSSKNSLVSTGLRITHIAAPNQVNTAFSKGFALSPDGNTLVFSARTAVSSEEPQPSIAVLPFADMSSGKDNEWFGDGLAEEIINALTKIQGLKVAGRTSSSYPSALKTM
ncbi:MAG: hypothetical protein JXB42_13695, partial [Deltaproteobacteria bacterium]|nr:hypothetical protein [Deltaproteobacteria bacterium]